MERSLFFECAHDTGPCRRGWHLLHTVEGEPVYFRRVGRSRGFAYVFGPRPDAERTKLVECGPQEGPWLCEACGSFVIQETGRLVE